MSNTPVSIHLLERRPRRLNGWQRLWLLIAVVWGAIVVLVSWSILAPETQGRIKARWADEKVSAEWEYFRQPGELLSDYRDRVFKHSSQEEIINPRILSADEFNPEEAEIVTDEDYIQKVHAMMREHDRIDREYTSRLASAPADLWRGAVVSMMVWAVPMLLLYILGMAIGWVRRGFRPAH